MKTIYSPAELYVTEVEQEAYDLSGQLALAQVRSHTVLRHQQGTGKPFWTAVMEAPEAFARGRQVRDRLCKEWQRSSAPCRTCGHPQSDHQDGTCEGGGGCGQSCPCKKFKPAKA